MLWLHILSGTIAIVAGILALYAPKGQRTHRRTGQLFALAMLVMTGSALPVAAFVSANPGNILVASVTLYLVATGWLSVRAPGRGARALQVALAALGGGSAVYGGVIASIAFGLPGRSMAGIPAAALGIFALVAALAVCGDARVMARGLPSGGGRILRHLWRMGFGLWVAVTSLFFGQADEFPLALRQSGLLALPVLAVTLTLLFLAFRQVLRVLRARRRGRPAPPAQLPIAG